MRDDCDIFQLCYVYLSAVLRSSNILKMRDSTILIQFTSVYKVLICLYEFRSKHDIRKILSTDFRSPLDCY